MCVCLNDDIPNLIGFCCPGNYTSDGSGFCDCDLPNRFRSCPSMLPE